MSHFTVLVIGENPEAQLQPYHEYECTGIEDEHVVFVPAEENLEEEYKEHKDDYSTLAEFAKDYYGYKEENGVYGRYTSPNKKWDWYVLGGRWTGFFKLKDDAESEGEIGRPGIMTSPALIGYVDAALKKHIDFDAMRKDKGKKAAKEYDTAMKIIGHLPVNKTWEEIRGDKAATDESRNTYWSQPRCKAWKDADTLDQFGWDSSPDAYLVNREDFIKSAEEGAISFYAVVKDGKWYEKGEMGWWGISLNEKEKDQWNKEFTNLLDGLPEDTLLSLYDCHI